MSRTDLDAHTLARSLRRMAGDGSVEWVMEPIQADVLRDIADMLDDIDATAMRQGDAAHDLMAPCDWRDGTLFLVLPEDPERIGVRLFLSRHAPSRMYVPMAEAAQLKDENAKLRELVDAWMGCGTRYHTMSGACPMFDANAKDCCKAEEIARELGVEVSNA